MSIRPIPRHEEGCWPAAAPGDPATPISRRQHLLGDRRRPTRARGKSSARSPRENPAARIVVTGCYATGRLRRSPPCPACRAGPAQQRKSAFAEAIGLTPRERFGAGDGRAAPHRARRRRPDRLHASCADRLRRDVRYCIIPSTRGTGRSRTVADVVWRSSARRRRGLPGNRADRRAPRLLRPGSSEPSSLLAAAADDRAVMRADALRISSLEPMDCSDAVVELVARAPGLRAAFPSAAAARQRPHAGGMRRPYTLADYDRLVGHHPCAHPPRLDRVGRDRRISGRDGRRLPAARAVPHRLAADASPRVSLFGSARHRCDGDAEKVHGAVVRTRATRVREIGRDLAARFHRAQDGAIRPALTIDDGRRR